MDAPAPRQFGSVEDCVEQVLARVGRRIVLCTPIGAGKPVALVNAFYRRAAADPAHRARHPDRASRSRGRSRKPSSSGGWSSRSRAKSSATRRSPRGSRRCAPGRLPPNVRVQEFFMEPGAWLDAPLAQQSYASINYTHVARSVLARRRERDRAAGRAARPGGRASLGTNPDVTADLIPMLRERERRARRSRSIGQVNDRMPFMFGAADMPASGLDFVVDDPRGYHELSRRRTCRSRPPSTRSRSRRAC